MLLVTCLVRIRKKAIPQGIAFCIKEDVLLTFRGDKEIRP